MEVDTAGGPPTKDGRGAGSEPVTISLPKNEEEVRDVWIDPPPTETGPDGCHRVPFAHQQVHEGFVKYKLERTSTLRQKVHLIEFDFLVGGRRLSMGEPLPAGDFYALISRGDSAPELRSLHVDSAHPLPTIPIPLVPPDEEYRTVDLGRVHDRLQSRSIRSTGRL